MGPDNACPGGGQGTCLGQPPGRIRTRVHGSAGVLEVVWQSRVPNLQPSEGQGADCRDPWRCRNAVSGTFNADPCPRVSNVMSDRVGQVEGTFGDLTQ